MEPYAVAVFGETLARKLHHFFGAVDRGDACVRVLAEYFLGDCAETAAEVEDTNRLFARPREQIDEEVQLLAPSGNNDVGLLEEVSDLLLETPSAAAAGHLDFLQSVDGNGLLLVLVPGQPAVKKSSAAGAGFAAEKALRGNHRAVAHRRASEGFARPHAKFNRLSETAAILTGAAGIRTQLFLLDE